ncbi:MAG: phosphatase PAP2 family protein [Parasphingopyxis sp.]
MEHRPISHAQAEPLARLRGWPRWPWLLIAAVAAIDLVWLAVAPAQLTAASWRTIAMLVPIILAALYCARRFRDREIVYVLCAGIAFLLAAWPVLRLFNHLTMSTALPWADPALSRMDGLLGFDWFAYIAWLDSQPWLLKLMGACYTGLDRYSVFFFALLACAAGRRTSCFELIGLFVISAVLCSAIGMAFPAQAAMAYYAPDLTGMDYVHAAVGTYHIEHLERLRGATAPILDLGNLPGLVTFPSFHTAMGIILIYVCRRSRPLFAASLAINVTMIAATPLFGSHYVIDLIGGVIAALVSIAIFAKLQKLEAGGRAAAAGFDWPEALAGDRAPAPLDPKRLWR